MTSYRKKLLYVEVIFYVGGDFNARIHHIRAGDADVCGPYVIGRGMEYLNHMNEKTKESRALFPRVVQNATA